MDLIAGLLKNEPQFKGIAYWSVGTGGQSENPPSKDALRRILRLNNEIYRKPLTPDENIAYDAASRTITVRVTFGPHEALGALNEYGLYGGNATSLPDSGCLINYAVHEVPDRREGEWLKRELKLTLTSDDMLDRALDLVAGLLSNATDLRGIQYLAVGTGDPKWDQGVPTSERVTKTLKNEILRLSLRRSRDLRYDSKRRILKALQTIAYDVAVGQLREIGLFGGDATPEKDSGYLFQYQIHSTIDKSQPIQLERAVEINLGPEPKIKVPKLVGLIMTQAQARVDQAKLNLGRIKKIEKDQHLDRIISQDPSPDTIVAEGISVDIVVAVALRVEVPDLIGLTVNEAKKVLREVSLNLSEEEPHQVESEAPEGSIVGQKPLPGAKIAKGSEIRIVLAKPIHVIVPVISGLTVDEGTVVLHKVKLKMAKPPYEERGNGEPYGTILEQIPAAGESVPRYTAIKVVVSGPHKVKVPDLTGKTSAEGADLLRKAAALLLKRLGRPPFPPGLSLGDQESIESENNIGKIIKQTPGAGEWAPLYGTVDVGVAMALSVEMPSLLGLTVPQATEILEKKGLSVGEIRSRPDIANAKTIVDQDPDPGLKVSKGSKIDVVIAEAHMVKVPDLVDKNLVYAREITKSRGLELKDDPVSHLVPEQLWVKSQKPPGVKIVPLGSQIEVKLITEVPKVVGKQVNVGREIQKKIGLKLEVVSEKESTRPAGEILKQEPAAKEKVLLNSTVKVEISKGLTLVAVPNVVGKKKAQAEEILKEKKLGMTVADELESEKEKGTVLEQDPGIREKVPKETRVKVILSKGPPLIVVPEIKNRLVDEAERSLKEVGLEIKVAEERPSTKAKGMVLEQEPEADKKVPKGSTVKVVISKGPDVVAVPNLINQSLSSAAEILKEKKLNIFVSGRIESSWPKDTVLEQKPEPGEKITEGSSVKVVVSKGLSMVVVPDVLGELLDEAREILKKEGLNSTIGRRLESDKPISTVLFQEPRARTRVSKGTTIRLDVSKGEDATKITVPNIVGQLYKQVDKALEKLGLKLVVAGTEISRNKSGTVLSQNPKSGTKVRKGTAINVVIAKAYSRGTTIPIRIDR
jgi:beta-lactam-binding protein with PASTA domain